MPICQTNLWTCEVCGSTQTTTAEVMPGDYPVVCSPGNEEWEYITVGKHKLLACPECVVKVVKREE